MSRAGHARLGKSARAGTSLICVLALAGCASSRVASVSGGECRVFERPQYQVLGRADYDQRWIDGNIEAGVAGCGWQRPAARPANLQPSRTVAAPAKKTIRERVKALVTRAPKAAPAPSWPPVTAPPVAITPPQPATPPAPVDLLDEPPIRRR
jgi:hypothetical protein